MRNPRAPSFGVRASASPAPAPRIIQWSEIAAGTTVPLSTGSSTLSDPGDTAWSFSASIVSGARVGKYFSVVDLGQYLTAQDTLRMLMEIEQPASGDAQIYVGLTEDGTSSSPSAYFITGTLGSTRQVKTFYLDLTSGATAVNNGSATTGNDISVIAALFDFGRVSGEQSITAYQATTIANQSAGPYLDPNALTAATFVRTPDNNAQKTSSVRSLTPSSGPLMWFMADAAGGVTNSWKVRIVLFPDTP